MDEETPLREKKYSRYVSDDDEEVGRSNRRMEGDKGFDELDEGQRKLVEDEVEQYARKYLKNSADRYEDIEEGGMFSKAVKVVTTSKFYAKIKSVCNVIAIGSGVLVPPFVYIGTSDGFIGTINLVLVIVPLLYVLAKNMEVDGQNRDIQDKNNETCSRLGIPWRELPASRQLFANFLTTLFAMILTVIAFFLSVYSGGEDAYLLSSTIITTCAIFFSGITKLLSARALRKHQNKLLKIAADLKDLDKEFTVKLAAKELLEQNKTLMGELEEGKHVTRTHLMNLIKKLSEENRQLTNALEAERKAFQAYKKLEKEKATRQRKIIRTKRSRKKLGLDSGSYEPPSTTTSPVLERVRLDN